ncbi:hypothetical protein Lalb_Chr16g0385641 [Lupinus albus]|uniref:Uncharacterized protein n=1 Tax=Lupinus albus TaxID=3870 RepID=A0A6A4NY09_LUPAL|nr:hypothetical protein Lalb_Chr16g0385641 [Lupinus albus]
MPCSWSIWLIRNQCLLNDAVDKRKMWENVLFEWSKPMYDQLFCLGLSLGRQLNLHLKFLVLIYFCTGIWSADACWLLVFRIVLYWLLG